MRNTTFFFLCFQAADFATTAVGMKMGMQELNPIQHIYGWNTFIIIKIILAIIVALALQFKRKSKLDMLIPGILALFIVFNAFQLVLAW